MSSECGRRVRDLRGRDRWFAIAVLVLVLVPFAVAIARAVHDGLVPSGDEANIAIRALDVFSRHRPLTGLPSTSGLYGEKIVANHPGPIEFYLLALPLRAFGLSAGSLLTAAAINAGCVLITLWVFLRRLGPTAMLWAAALLLAVMWSTGTAVLTDTLSSNMPLYSLLATAALAWAVIDGDIALLPLGAFVAGYAAQQHLAAGLIVAPVVVVVIAVLVTRAFRDRRADASATTTARPWVLASAAIAALCWAPVAYDQLTGHPGNLTQILRFARDDTRPTLGFGSGVDQALHAVTPPTVLAHTDTTGLFFLPGLGAFRFVAGMLVVGALVAVVWCAWRRFRALAWLALVALVLLAAGVVNGSNVPLSFEQVRVNLYRWTWATTFTTWAALGIALVFLVGRAAGSTWVTDRAKRLGPPALLVVCALIAISIAFVSGADDHDAQQPGFAAEKRVGAAVLAGVDRSQPVVVIGDGFAATQAVAPYVLMRLIDAGVRVEVPGPETGTYGPWRQYRARSNPYALVITTGAGPLAAVPGRQIANQLVVPERTALIDSLVAAARGAHVQLAVAADALIAREDPGVEAFYVRSLFAHLPTNPRAALEQPAFLRLVSEGALVSPKLDRTDVKRLLALPAARNTLLGDEQVEVHLLDPDQLRNSRFATPEWSSPLGAPQSTDS